MLESSSSGSEGFVADHFDEIVNLRLQALEAR
jgi:hypothetical protein